MIVRGTGVKGFAKGKAFVVKDLGQRNPFEDIPFGSVLVVSELSLSDSALIDFKNIIGIVTEKSDPDGQALVIARGVGIPAIVGIENCTKDIVSGDRIIIRNFDVLVNPDLDAVNEFERVRSDSDSQLSLDI